MKLGIVEAWQNGTLEPNALVLAANNNHTPDADKAVAIADIVDDLNRMPIEQIQMAREQIREMSQMS